MAAAREGRRAAARHATAPGPAATSSRGPGRPRALGEGLRGELDGGDRRRDAPPRRPRVGCTVVAGRSGAAGRSLGRGRRRRAQVGWAEEARPICFSCWRPRKMPDQRIYCVQCKTRYACRILPSLVGVSLMNVQLANSLLTSKESVRLLCKSVDNHKIQTPSSSYMIVSLVKPTIHQKTVTVQHMAYTPSHQVAKYRVNK